MGPPSLVLDRFRAAAETAHPAVLDGEGAHTYREVHEHALRVAGALLGERASLGGERVALLVAPGASFLEAFFGVLFAGGVVVVLSPLHPAPETAYFCEDAGVRTLVASPEQKARLAPVEAGRRVLVTDELRALRASRPLPAVLASDPALQLYTSGTTGKPKGAIITHENLAVQQALLREGWGMMDSDVLLHALPLHHLHGLGIALLTALGAGAAARLLPHFDAVAMWEAMPASTVLMAVPTMYTKLLAAFDAADPATQTRWAAGARALRLATSGSAALPVTLGERWKSIAGSYPLERFGMTEIGVGMINPLHGERRPGTVGKPLPTVDVRIVADGTSPALPERGPNMNDGTSPALSGELWIRGPSVFVGYHRREEATAAAFVPADDGGRPWFRTGDTVTRDEAGYVKILGRTSVDILKSGGYKLSALEIEEVLREHPAILEVAVVGLPDETWGERVVACVIAREGREAECGEDGVRAFAKERLAGYKIPKSVVRMRELPRNAVGKVLKPELVKNLTRTLPEK